MRGRITILIITSIVGASGLVAGLFLSLRFDPSGLAGIIGGTVMLGTAYTGLRLARHSKELAPVIDHTESSSL
jgi:hypothetical protein